MRGRKRVGSLGPPVHRALIEEPYLRIRKRRRRTKPLARELMARVSSQVACDEVALKLMGALQQVLVVDDGVRAIDHSLAGELAELGYASVTVSLEAAADVLAVIARPAAILLQTSVRRDSAYARLATRLCAQMREQGIPVLVIDGSNGRRAGAPIDLMSRIGPYVVSEPEL